MSVIKTILILSSIAMMSFSLSAQSELDSLWGVWQDTGRADSTRVEAYKDYIREGFIRSQPDSALKLAEELVHFAKLQAYPKGEMMGLNLQGIVYYYKGDYPKALQFYSNGLKIAEQINEQQDVAKILNNIGIVYQMQGDYPKALEHYAKSLKIKEQLGDQSEISNTQNYIGLIYNHLGDYPKALEYFSKSLKIAEQLEDQLGIADGLNGIGLVYFNNGDPSKALAFYTKSLKLYEQLGDQRNMATTLRNIGSLYRDKGDYSKALDYDTKSLNISEQLDNQRGILISLNNLGSIYEAIGNFAKALDYYSKGLMIAEQLGDQLGISGTNTNIGKVYFKNGNYPKALEHCKNGFVLAKSMGSLVKQKVGCACLYDTYKAMGNGNKALEYHELLTLIDDSLKAEETVKKLQKMEFSRQMVVDSIVESQEDLLVEIAHKEEVRKKNRSRNILLGIGTFVFLVAASLFWRLQYVRKSKATLQIEKDRSENLLLNILPEEIAEELKQNGKAKAQDIDKVTILFTDFKGFTAASSKLSAQDLVGEIGTCFEAFDHIMEKYNIEKIKTIGDAYMAASGLPIPFDNSTKNAVLAALEMQAYISRHKTENDTAGKPAFEMRVGIHTGAVVAGIVGVKKFQYDIWGDTVNTASRMESNGEIGKVNISDATYQLLKDDPDFKFEDRGDLEVKGKGKMKMWFIESI